MYRVFTLYGSGKTKYNMDDADRNISEILGESTPHLGLVKAAYAEASWKKINSALNAYKNFCLYKNVLFKLPIDHTSMSDFISWAALERKLSPDSIKSYISNIKLIHKLKGLPTDGCSSFLCKTLIRGAENLRFYSNEKKDQKKVMSLPLLRILGHELANSNWSDHSKVVIWSTYTVAFMGSFRLGELLAKSETEFNPLETLMWQDIKFMSDDSIQIHVKVPKTRTAKGEHISLFPFPFYGCCPVAAIKKLKSLAEENGDLNKPVFMFDSGRLLTKAKLNKIIQLQLFPHIGIEARYYSCKSFRAALPSALAANPHMTNDSTIKRWGRWNSKAFERYTRLSHSAKRKLFKKFIKALSYE
jgi:hypothetical protein